MAPEPLCDTDPSEQGLVAAVVEHYRQCLASSGSAREALLGLGISPSVAKRFSLGLSDRSLGLRLPERNRRAGKHLPARRPAGASRIQHMFVWLASRALAQGNVLSGITEEK